MNTKYRKYAPRDIFISFLGREATEEELWLGAQGGVIYNKLTGIEFLDIFASMVHQNMCHYAYFYARKLGVTTTELSGCLKVLTGLKTDEWITAYLWLAIRDVLLHTDWPLSEVAKKMGFSSLKTFSCSFIKRVGIPPSDWRRKYKGKG